MKFKSIQYSESHEYSEYGFKRWLKIGMEADLDDGENPLEAHKTLRQCVSEIKAETLTHIEEYRGTTTRTIEEKPVNATIQGIIDDLNKCTAVYEKNGLGVQTGLVAYEEAASKFPEILTAYDLKMYELTNPK